MSSSKFTSLRGFTVSLPGRQVDPYYRIFLRAFTDTANGVTPLAEVLIPNGRSFVLTDLRFIALQTTGQPTGNQTVLGVGNDLIFGSAIRFEMQVTGALNSVGQFYSTDASGSTSFAGLSRLNVSVRDILGWPTSYGVAIEPGGRIVTRAFQFGTFGAGAVIPDALACEVSGFLAPRTFVNAYLDAQSDTSDYLT